MAQTNAYVGEDIIYSFLIRSYHRIMPNRKTMLRDSAGSLLVVPSLAIIGVLMSLVN